MKCLVSFLVLSILGLNILSAQSKVDFYVSNLPQSSPMNIGIRGNLYPLSWDKSIFLEKTDSGFHTMISFNETEEMLEFKFVLFDDDNNLIWEKVENRLIQLRAGEELVSLNEWDVDPLFDIATLPLIQPSELMEDYQLIETMVLNVHPGTYRYNDSKSIQIALDELKYKFQSPLNHGQAFLAISKLLASLECGHTYANFLNQNAKLKSFIHAQKNKLPFAFEWIDERMIILNNASQKNQLQRGAEVLSINSIPSSDILKALMPYVSADGGTDKTRIAKLAVDGFDFRYYEFDVFFPLLFELVEDSIRLEVRNYNENETELVNVELLSLTERHEELIKRYPDFPRTKDDLWSFKFLNDDLALLTLNSFGLMGWRSLSLDYRKYFEEVFAELNKRNPSKLIIDIRKNNGGNDEIMKELYTYLNLDRFAMENEEGRARYIDFPESLKPHISSWGDPWYYHLEALNPETKDGYFVISDVFNTNIKVKRKKNSFKGEYFLLTSPVNESLAYYFPRYFKKYNIGTIVGGETGGNLRGINGGQIMFLRLPNSEIEVDFPIIGEFMLTDFPNQGVSPDVEVQVTQEDIFLERDPAIETILNSTY